MTVALVIEINMNRVLTDELLAFEVRQTFKLYLTVVEFGHLGLW